MKLCTICKQNPPRSGSRSWCSECSLAYERARWNALDKDTRRNRHLKKRYKKDISWFYSKLEEQKNLCAVCEEEVDPDGGHGKSKACVDHNHTTGEVRGLLCNHCNRALGLFNENTETLKKAIEYLEKYK